MKKSEEPKDIQKLAEEIRRLGLPYSSEAPEPLFWANQRVRILDRISEAQQPASIIDQIIGWVSGHVMGTSIAATALALLVAAALVFKPFGNEPKPIAMAPKAVPSAPETKLAEPQTIQSVSRQESIAQAQLTDKKNKPEHELAVRGQKAKPSVEMAALTDEVSVPVLSSSDVEHPVSLEELSQPELEDVLNSMQHSE